MEFRNCVENRRSIRSFRPDPVRREDILYCLDAARLSPSSLNCQPWRFVVLDDPQLKNRAAGYISNPLLKSNLHARQAPVLIAVVSDLSENPNPLYRTAVKKFGMYQYDLGAAVQTLCLAAADLGLGSCIMSTIRNKKQLQDLLSIPQGQEICLVVALRPPGNGSAWRRSAALIRESRQSVRAIPPAPEKLTSERKKGVSCETPFYCVSEPIQTRTLTSGDKGAVKST